MTKLIHENGNVNSSTQMLSLSVWRAATSVNLMLNTQEHQSLLTRLIGGIEAKNVITRLGANRISEAAIIGN